MVAFDSAWGWFWANIGTIADLLIIAGAIVGVVLWFLERSHHPKIQITRLSKEYPSAQWGFGWQILNVGGETATGVDVNVEIAASYDTLGVYGSAKRFKLFDGIDVVPEKVRNDSPPSVVFIYNPPDEKFTLYQPLFHATVESLEVKRGSAFADFSTEAHTENEPHIPLAYTVEIILSGKNLTNADRRTHRYLVSVYKGVPNITDLESLRSV